MDVEWVCCETKVIKNILADRHMAYLHTDNRSIVADRIMSTIGNMESLQLALDLNDIKTFFLLVDDLMRSKNFNIGKCFQKVKRDEEDKKVDGMRQNAETKWTQYVAKVKPWI